MKQREYQQRTFEQVESIWRGGARSVLVVAPTGAGKTHMGLMLLGQRRGLWAAPRRELVSQAAVRLRSLFGASAVGEIMPGAPQNRAARIQVGTVQIARARGATARAERSSRMKKSKVKRIRVDGYWRGPAAGGKPVLVKPRVKVVVDK